MEVTGLKLKVLFLLHLFCAMFAMMAWPNNVSRKRRNVMEFTYLSLQGFLFVNVVFHFCLIWSLAQPTMIDPMVVTGAVNVLAILFEIVHLSLYWPGNFTTHDIMFSAVMVIVNLLLFILSASPAASPPAGEPEAIGGPQG